MRGKDKLIELYEEGVGITPAHAGKRFKFLSFFGIVQDHPRTCGEK